MLATYQRCKEIIKTELAHPDYAQAYWGTRPQKYSVEIHIDDTRENGMYPESADYRHDVSYDEHVLDVGRLFQVKMIEDPIIPELFISYNIFDDKDATKSLHCRNRYDEDSQLRSLSLPKKITMDISSNCGNIDAFALHTPIRQNRIDGIKEMIPLENFTIPKAFLRLCDIPQLEDMLSQEKILHSHANTIESALFEKYLLNPEKYRRQISDYLGRPGFERDFVFSESFLPFLQLCDTSQLENILNKKLLSSAANRIESALFEKHLLDPEKYREQISDYLRKPNFETNFDFSESFLQQCNIPQLENILSMHLPSVHFKTIESALFEKYLLNSEEYIEKISSYLEKPVFKQAFSSKITDFSNDNLNRLLDTKVTHDVYIPYISKELFGRYTSNWQRGVAELDDRVIVLLQQPGIRTSFSNKLELVTDDRILNRLLDNGSIRADYKLCIRERIFNIYMNRWHNEKDTLEDHVISLLKQPGLRVESKLRNFTDAELDRFIKNREISFEYSRKMQDEVGRRQPKPPQASRGRKRTTTDSNSTTQGKYKQGTLSQFFGPVQSRSSSHGRGNSGGHNPHGHGGASRP